MTAAGDGGRRALCGYLYQMVGAFAMKASAHCRDVSSDSAELDALIELAPGAEVMHEYMDQDVVLGRWGVTGREELVLVQFKFSRVIPRPTIGKSELMTRIVPSLAAAIKKANKLGRNVTGWALVTNRQMGSSALESITKAKAGQSLEGVSDRNRVTAAELRIVEDVSLAQFEESLQSFAARFGVEDSEIEEGINELVGGLVRRAMNGIDASIAIEDIKQAFIGCRDARPLTRKALKEFAGSELETLEQTIGLPGKPIRRRLLEALADAVGGSGRALVFLHGKGGTGKTVVLWQWAHESCLPVGFAAANEIPSQWMSNTICDWASLPGNHPRRIELLDRALDRLWLADPETGLPMIGLGLDGLDEEMEGADQRQRVREIFRWFCQEDRESVETMRPARAVMVVTSRDPDETIRMFCTSRTGYYTEQADLYKKVEVKEFLPDELLKVADANLPQLRTRLEAALLSAHEGGASWEFASEEPITVEYRAYSPAAVDPDVLEVLHIPSMWGALVSLGDASLQSSVLDGDQDSVSRMILKFVDRFCEKLVQRGKNLGLQKDQVLAILCSVARRSHDNGSLMNGLAVWSDPACEAGDLGKTSAKSLHREAISAGLIEWESTSHWRWRHPLLEEVLAGCEAPGMVSSHGE